MSLKKKKSRTIADLQAQEEAYGHKLTPKSIFQTIFLYAASVAAFAFILYSNVIVTVVLFLVAMFLCYKFILPREVAIRYYRRGLNQRNRCISIITQALTNPSNTVYNCMSKASDRLEGEFKQDLEKLNAVLITSNNKTEVHSAFKIIEDKYRDDVIFTQFFEQLETANFEGTLNLNTFKMLQRYHTQLFEKQNDYVFARRAKKKEVFSLTGVVFGLIAILAFGTNGYDNYVKVFSHSFIGIISGTLFMLFYGFILTKFFKYYYDESITTID